MKITKELTAYYPPTEYRVVLTDDLAFIANELRSTCVTSWGQGQIPGTNYFELAGASPVHKGDKALRIVASVQDVERARAR